MSKPKVTQQPELANKFDAREGRSIRVVGLDPGPDFTGYAVVDRDMTHRGMVRWVDGGYVGSTRRELDVVMRIVGHGGGVAGVEMPEGYIHEHARGAALLATARVGGIIVEKASSWDLAVLERPATSWRLAVCGKTNASNALVASFVKRFTIDMPSRTNEHVRDALGMAICTMWNAGKAAFL